MASLPLNDLDAALEEADRVITQLKFRGVQIFSDINGEPLGLPKFRPLYEKMAQYDLPLWIHPRGGKALKDLLDEDAQKHGILFTYENETALAMLQLVSAGIFQEYPGLEKEKIFAQNAVRLLRLAT